MNELGLKDSWLKVWQVLVANPGADPEVVRQVQQAMQKLYQDHEQRTAFSQATDLQLDPDHVILNRSFLTEQVKYYQNLSKKISTFSGQ